MSLAHNTSPGAEFTTEFFTNLIQDISPKMQLRPRPRMCSHIITIQLQGVTDIGDIFPSRSECVNIVYF